MEHQVAVKITDTTDTEPKNLPSVLCNMKINHEKLASSNQIMYLPGLLEHQLHLAEEYLSQLTQVHPEEAWQGSAINLESAAAA